MLRFPVALALILLAGCHFHSPAESMLDDYLSRLARVLDQPKPEVERQSPPQLPPPRELQIVIEPLSIDLLDYWAFRKCGLTSLLSERNSILGRVMQPSQLLHMDGRLIRQLRICQNELEDEELVALTDQLLEQKLEQWPLRYWNATIAAPEMRRFWSPSTAPFVPERDESFVSAEAAMAFLANLPEQLYAPAWPESSELELHYQQLDSYQLGGKLLQSLQLASDYLIAANSMLERAIASESLCPGELHKPELDYARNVMIKVFVGELQPWFATLNRRSSSLFEHYDHLIQTQARDLQPRIKPHQAATQKLFNQFQQLNRDHVELWQELFESCGSRAIPHS